MFETIQRLISGVRTPMPGFPVFIVAIISIISKEIIFHYTKRVGEKLNSSLLIANAWHSRSDAISSIVVLVGAGFSYFGFQVMDSLAAVLVSFFIAKVGWSFLNDSIKELVDTSLDSQKTREIKQEILRVPGVLGMHDLRSRTHGRKAVLDVNIQVSPNITVSEGHEISAWVMKRLVEKFDMVEDVTVHTDVEDDRGDSGESFTHSRLELLPLRPELVEEIRNSWSKISNAPMLNDIHLHYLGGKVLVDLYLLNSSIEKKQVEEWTAKVRQDLASAPWFKDVRLWCAFI